MPPTGRSTFVRPVARLVVGEDVVELVAAAPARRQAPHVRALAVALLELGLGLVVDGLALVLVLVFDGEAEVDERAVPGVAECHDVEGFVRGRKIPSKDYDAYRYSVEPRRTIVAPSSTATS